MVNIADHGQLWSTHVDHDHGQLMLTMTMVNSCWPWSWSTWVDHSWPWSAMSTMVIVIMGWPWSTWMTMVNTADHGQSFMLTMVSSVMTVVRVVFVGHSLTLMTRCVIVQRSTSMSWMNNRRRSILPTLLMVGHSTRDLRIVYFRSNRISNGIGRPIRLRIESSNRIGRIFNPSVFCICGEREWCTDYGTRTEYLFISIQS